jgi:hypothetical protein
VSLHGCIHALVLASVAAYFSYSCKLQPIFLIKYTTGPLYERN